MSMQQKIAACSKGEERGDGMAAVTQPSRLRKEV